MKLHVRLPPRSCGSWRWWALPVSRFWRCLAVLRDDHHRARTALAAARAHRSERDARERAVSYGPDHEKICSRGSVAEDPGWVAFSDDLLYSHRRAVFGGVGDRRFEALSRSLFDVALVDVHSEGAAEGERALPDGYRFYHRVAPPRLPDRPAQSPARPL